MAMRVGWILKEGDFLRGSAELSASLSQFLWLLSCLAQENNSIPIVVKNLSTRAVDCGNFFCGQRCRKSFLHNACGKAIFHPHLTVDKNMLRL